MPVKINRVHLKDYRIHENNEFIFDRGINLILGKNGSGKSSILEAIGLAMFDADIRSNITDAVRYGQKTAVITVEFEGNDDNTYVGERKIGQVSSFKLSLKGEPAARINGKEQVLSKIKKLATITANEKSLFQNVITAYQNKITGIFEEKPTRREIIFNQIFDTAIYREMYEQFLKQARDEYQQQIALKNQSISDLLAKMKDTSQLKKELREKTVSKEADEKKLNKLKKEVSSIEKACSELENLKRKIDSAQSDFKHSEQMKEAKLNELKKTQSELDESTNSLPIIEKN